MTPLGVSFTLGKSFRLVVILWSVKNFNLKFRDKKISIASDQVKNVEINNIDGLSHDRSLFLKKISSPRNNISSSNKGYAGK